MQALYRDAAIASTPRPYLNHIPPPALNRGETEQSRDVIYLVDDDLQLSKQITESLTALPAQPIVFVVHNDTSVRESLKSLIRCEGWQSETFAFAGEFLARPRPLVPNCLVLDVPIRDLSGLDLQRRVVVERPDTPVIFVTGHGDVPTSVQAMKAGAIEFLMVSVRGTHLLEAERL